MSIWMDKGRVRSSGPTEQVVDDYMHSSTAPSSAKSIAIDPSLSAQVVGVALVDEEGVPQATLTTRSSSWIQVDVVANEPPPTLDVTCQVATRGGTGILDEALSDVEVGALSRPGRYRVRCHLPPILAPGEYTISVGLGSAYEWIDQHENIVAFTVDGDDLGRVRRLVRLAAEWQAIRLDDHILGE